MLVLLAHAPQIEGPNLPYRRGADAGPTRSGARQMPAFGGRHPTRSCSRAAGRETENREAAPAAPMRNGVGSTGSAPPVNMTSAACVSPQPAIGRIVRSASFGVVMIL